MDPITTSEVAEHLRPHTRELGYSTHSLMGNWDDWIKRRVEQVELVSDAAAKRRISVDFRLAYATFGEPILHEGADKSGVHYVPLTLLHKAPVTNFNLRDESNAAVPLLTRRMTASIGGATLVAATTNMIAQQHVFSGSESELAVAMLDPSFELSSIKLPTQLEADFLSLCILPWAGRVDGANEPTAKDFIKGLLWLAREKDQLQSTEWRWTYDVNANAWTPDIDYRTWVAATLKDPIMRSLIYDFARLYMVAAPVAAERGRRRILKLEYEEHLRQPGLTVVERVRRGVGRHAQWLRQSEDWLEGLNPDESIAQQEWTPPRTGMNEDGDGAEPPRHNLLQAIALGIGWLSKPIHFPLPSVGLGGTFHLEIISPMGTQLRRARLGAYKLRSMKKGAEPQREKAHRYARNVDRAHLYLGSHKGELQGTAGKAMMSIKPKSSTVIRGAAIAACFIGALGLLAAVRSAELSKDSQSAIAILLLAPGAVAVIAGQPFPSVTSGMIFGLRLVALTVAAVAVAIAALLGSHTTFDQQPVIWTLLLVIAFGLAAVLLEAWRLAGRDWPRRFKN